MRRLFTLTSGLSLLLLLATAVLWVRSYSISAARMTIGDELELGNVEVYSVWGRLSVASGPPPATTSKTVVTTAPDGTTVETTSVHAYLPRHRVSVPYLAVVPLTALLPILCVIRARRTARQSRDPQCVACGYNLTGNISGVCPECGAAACTSAARKKGFPG